MTVSLLTFSQHSEIEDLIDALRSLSVKFEYPLRRPIYVSNNDMAFAHTDGDTVLIDVGLFVHGYFSPIALNLPFSTLIFFLYSLPL